MAKKRDYKKEYAEYHSKPEQKKNRAMRNTARAEMTKLGKVKKGDGMEVDHKNPLSKGGTNNKRNWKVISKTANRKKGNKK
jgi:5-methylcytosine-specific restriction endonuclease McrA